MTIGATIAMASVAARCPSVPSTTGRRCDWCRKPFEPRKGNQRFDRPACKMQAYLARKRGRPAQRESMTRSERIADAAAALCDCEQAAEGR